MHPWRTFNIQFSIMSYFNTCAREPISTVFKKTLRVLLYCTINKNWRVDKRSNA